MGLENKLQRGSSQELERLMASISGISDDQLAAALRMALNYAKNTHDNVGHLVLMESGILHLIDFHPERLGIDLRPLVDGIRDIGYRNALNINTETYRASPNPQVIFESHIRLIVNLAQARYGGDLADEIERTRKMFYNEVLPTLQSKVITLDPSSIIEVKE